MIYSKFGTELALVSKTESASGRVSIQATTPGETDIREYELADLKADDGLAEVTSAVAKLPLKVFENNIRRQRLSDYPRTHHVSRRDDREEQP